MSNVIKVDQFEIPRTEFKFLGDRQVDAMKDPFCYVPEHTRDGIIRWIEFGIEPGSFLTAVIQNDLKNSFGQADQYNAEALQTIVAWFYNHAPEPCWGSVDKFKDWKLDREEQLEQLRSAK